MKLYKQKEDGSYEEVEVFRTFKDQAEFDESVKERVERERKKVSEQFADYDTIKTSLENANKKVGEFETTKKTLEEQIEEKSKEVEKERLNTVRVGVRHEFGLKPELDKFLVGETEDEIKANAEILKKSGPAGGEIIINKDKGGDGAKESPSKELANGLFNPKGD